MKSTARVNPDSFYCVDRDCGPFFLQFCSYFPYNAQLCRKGHEYVQRPLEREPIASPAWDNGLLSCPNPERLQALSAEKIEARLRRLPHPFRGGDREAGSRYPLSLLQIELSLPPVLDRPGRGRIFCEEGIRENLDRGRPKPGQLLFERGGTNRTPGLFRPRVIVVSSLPLDYQGSRLQPYPKEGRALRTATPHPEPR